MIIDCKKHSLHSWYKVFTFISLFILSSCSDDLTFLKSNNNKNKISFLGIAPQFASIISANHSLSFWPYAYAAGCSVNDVKAELYSFESNGSLTNEALATKTIRSDGSFEFDLSAFRSQLKNEVEFVVKVYGCDELAIGPVLDIGTQQVIDSRTSFISANIESNVTKKLNEIPRVELKSLLNKLSGSNLEEVNTNLKLDTVVATEYQRVFDIPITNVELAPLVGVSIPTSSVAEESITVFVPTIKTATSSYPLWLEWSVDGVVVSQSSHLTWSYQPSKNAQGERKLSLRVGAKKTSANELDISRPFSTTDFTVKVDNTFSPQSPQLIFESQYSNTRNLIINFDKNLCSTFETLAITESNNSSHLTASDFIFDCTDENIPFQLSSADAVKTLYVFTRDAGGDISSARANTITLDTTSPSISSSSRLIGGGVSLRGGMTEIIEWSASDLNLGTHPITLSYSVNAGSSWTTIASNLELASTYPWTIPLIDSTSVILRLTAIDLAGNTNHLVSTSPFTVDSTAPGILSATLVQGAVTRLMNINATVSSCSVDQVMMLMSESALVPAREDSKWISCSSATGALTHTLTNTNNEVKTLYFWSKDAVGNISASSSRTIIFDNVAPVITQTILAANTHANTNTVVMGGVCETGSSIAVSGTDVAVSNCTSNAWSYTTASQSSDGVYSYIFTHTDPAGNSSTAEASWLRDTVRPTMMSTLIAEGAEYVGTNFVMVAVNASDNHNIVGIRLMNAHSVTKECLSEFADDSWQSYAGGVENFSTAISPGDGEKKICVWVKDRAGNSSLISTNGVHGIDMDTVKYEVGNPPVITSFDVHNGSGGTTIELGRPVIIEWSITDHEELAQNPVSLWYTTSSAATATWEEIVIDHGNIGIGQTTSSGSFTSFTSPSDGYFRVKMVAKDLAGNTSIVTEKSLNTKNWSIYAGSSDDGIGGSALSTKLNITSSSNIAGQYAAINPLTNDAYAVSTSLGIIKLNAVTGKTEVFISHGVTNFVHNTLINSSSKVNGPFVRLMFDQRGLLYVMESTSITGNAGNIWQIDPETKIIKKYLGGGTVIDATATATTAQVQFGHFTFDESNSLYYFAHCSGNIYYDHNTSGTTALRLMKATQNAITKEVANISIVAGNCTRGIPTSGAGVSSLDSPLIERGVLNQGGIAAWENGKKIYYRLQGSAGYKIFDGITYSSNAALTPYYDFSTQTLYSGGTAILKTVLNFNQSGGDVNTIYVATDGLGECLNDGINREDACVRSYAQPIRGPNGSIAFLDGVVQNATSTYRIRYVEDEKVKTYLGTTPFYGEGLDKSFLKSSIGGIHYKKNTDPNQSAFPEGLYFVDGEAMVMSYIGADGIVDILAGNQSKQTFSANTGAEFSRQLSLGTPYSNGKNMMSLVFNSEGLPHMRVATREKSLIKVKSDRTIQLMTDATVSRTYYDLAETGDNPFKIPLFVNGGGNNLIFKGNDTLFILGAYVHGTERPGILSAEMKALNFSSTTGVTHIMGVNTLAPASSADEASPGLLANLKFPSACHNISECYLQYRSDQDRLYFSEGKKLRYVEKPENPSLSILGTLFSSAQTIHNFIFNEDKTQVFYISSAGKLYCKDISSGKAWCDERELGPVSGMMTITRGPNQLTWKDSQTLLISGNNGMIYQYNLDP